MKPELLIHPDELSDLWIDRAVKSGVKRISLHPTGGKNAHESLDRLVQTLNTKAFRDKIDRLVDSGVEIGYEFHAAGYLLPRDLFETHPEYFRVSEEGERTAKGNFCFSNEEALRIVTDNAVKLAKSLYRTPKDLYFWLDDAKSGSCYCEKCRGRAYSDHQLAVINAMTEKLRRAWDADVKMCYLAYYEALVVPKEVKPLDGVFLEYAPIERYTMPETAAWSDDVRATVRSLLDFFGKQDAKVLEYWYDNSLFSRWQKPPKEFRLDKERQDADLLEYRALDFSTVASFACFLGEDYVSLFGEPDLSGLSELSE